MSTAPLRHCSLTTAATLPHGPSSGGQASWSDDNVLAIAGDRFVHLLHVSDMKRGRSVICLDEASKADRAGTCTPESLCNATLAFACKNHDLHRCAT
jgi:hypothetical protein